MNVPVKFGDSRSNDSRDIHQPNRRMWHFRPCFCVCGVIFNVEDMGIKAYHVIKFRGCSSTSYNCTVDFLLRTDTVFVGIGDMLSAFCLTSSNETILHTALERLPSLPVDDAIASRVVIVIVSGSEGRKRFGRQLNISKTVRDRPHVSMGS